MKMSFLQTLLAVHLFVGCHCQFSSLNNAEYQRTVGAMAEFSATYKPSQSAGIELLNWRFNSVTVAQLVINPDGSFSSLVITSDFTDRLTFIASKTVSTFTMPLTLINVSMSDNDILVDVDRGITNPAVLGNVTRLLVTVCPDQVNANVMSTTCIYNHYNCESTFVCNNGFESSNSPFEATCLADGTWNVNSSCTAAPNPPLPGWAIFLIILGALVLVFGGLFIAWWCIQAFRECLHGVSECFPEDHCCGKGSC